jgi:3-hydroxy acid dehydrogenase/malonic semialdehyde reductase
VILARRLDALEKVADACRAAHAAGSFADAQVAALALDVSDKDQVAGLLARLPARLQSADVLVNNAGLGATPGNIGGVALAEVEAVFGVNVVGVVALTQLFLGGMQCTRLRVRWRLTTRAGFKERGHGHIINLGSVVSREAAPGDPIYSASKWALRALSDAMRKELVGTPIRVTEIQPGKT